MSLASLRVAQRAEVFTGPFLPRSSALKCRVCGLCPGLLWASGTRLSTDGGKAQKCEPLSLLCCGYHVPIQCWPPQCLLACPHPHCPCLGTVSSAEQTHHSVTALPSSWMVLSSPPSADFETLLSVAHLSSMVFVSPTIRFGCLLQKTLNRDCSGTSFLSLSRSPEVSIPGMLPGSMVSETQDFPTLLLCHMWLLIVQHGCSSASRMQNVSTLQSAGWRKGRTHSFL